MAADGVDLGGEARLIDAIAPLAPGILDAGCGPGRVGAELAARWTHRVRRRRRSCPYRRPQSADHPGLDLALSPISPSLTSLSARTSRAVRGRGHCRQRYDLRGTGHRIGGPRPRRSSSVVPDGVVVVGFGTDRGYSLADFDIHVALAGLVLSTASRHGTFGRG